MPRISLSDLPAEVHFQILKNALNSAREPYYETNHRSSFDDEEKIPIGWYWIEEDRRKLSQFPYNVAAVCQLWYFVLIQIPECWTRVIIDVATDPSTFIDIFLWSKDLPNLEVTVFKSHNPADSQDVDYSTLERERVSAIADALLPHTSRCRSITFDVAFVTSLPSPVGFLLKDALHLYELNLECKINNTGRAKDHSRSCELGVREPIQTLSSCPKLKRLSLTGFWFMFISSHPHTSEWFKKICGEIKFFRISHFQFQKEGRYTLKNFVKCRSALKPETIILADLSFDHDDPVLGFEKYDEAVFARSEVTFRNVSPEVLRSLFFMANIRPNVLIFDNCMFPELSSPLRASLLHLKNIHYLPSPHPYAETHTKNLCSILRGFTGPTLCVTSCSAFDDNAISALQYSTPQYLYLKNCNNFTIRGLRQCLEKRDEHCVPHSDAVPRLLEFLSVDGIMNECPRPSDEDIEWFENSQYAQLIAVVWWLRDPETKLIVEQYCKSGTRAI